MYPTRVFLITVALGLSLCAQPSPEPQPAPEISKGQVANQKKGGNGLQGRTEESPSPGAERKANPSQFNGQNAKSDRGGKNGERKGDSEDSDPDRWMIVLTAGLVIVGAGQIYILWRQTNIIDQSFMLTEHPRLAIRNLVLKEPGYSARFISRDIREPVFKPIAQIEGTLAIVNSGGVKAIVSNSRCCVFSADQFDRLMPMELPDSMLKDGKDLLPTGKIIDPGETIHADFRGNGPSVKQLDYARSQEWVEPDLYLLGHIDYADDNGVTRRTAFCRRYVTALDRFVPMEDPDYEYAD